MQALSIATDSIIHLRYPEFFEGGPLATHNILNYSFHPRNEPRYQSTLLYARATHPNNFIKQVLAARTDANAVNQFVANHYTFLANHEKCHQPVIGAVSHDGDTPIASEATGNHLINILQMLNLAIDFFCGETINVMCDIKVMEAIRGQNH